MTGVHDNGDLVVRFYDTLINHAHWADALDEYAALCGAGAATLVVGDTLHPTIGARILGNRMKSLYEDLDDYNARFGASEAAAFGVVYARPVRTWVLDEDAFGIPADDLPCAAYQRERFGLFRRVGARLNQTPLWNDGIVLHFDDEVGLFDRDQETLSYRFLPHIAKVVELARPFRLLQQRFNAVLGVLNKLRVGVIITTRAGDVIAANSRAHDIGAMADGLMLTRDRRLKLFDRDDQTTLDRYIALASDAADPSGFRGVMSVSKRSAASQWILETFCISELTGEIDGAFQGACTFIIDPDHAEVVSTAGMKEAFGLTEAEAEVCRLLAAGLKVVEIADSRDTTPETVRSQMKSLFAKTASRNQADLVRQALKVNLPVEAPDK